MTLNESLEQRTLTIERLDRSKSYAPGTGYRFSDGFNYAFYDVYWQRVSEYYIIFERSRNKQHVSSRPPKDIIGPYAIEVLKPETSQETVDKKCLEKLMVVIKRNYPDVNIEASGNFDLIEIKGH